MPIVFLGLAVGAIISHAFHTAARHEAHAERINELEKKIGEFETKK